MRTRRSPLVARGADRAPRAQDRRSTGAITAWLGSVQVKMQRQIRVLGILLGTLLGTLLGGSVLLAGAPASADEACREWWGEHHRWKAEVVHRYLRGAAQRELDAAVFELLQREAWLTSCEHNPARARDGLVGWRLMDRVPDEFAGAVVDSLLERAGFDLSLETLVSPPVTPARRSGAARPGAARSADAHWTIPGGGGRAAR